MSIAISWENRKIIIKNAHKMINLMDNAPYAPFDFVAISHQETYLERLDAFVHHTFNEQDFMAIQLKKTYS